MLSSDTFSPRSLTPCLFGHSSFFPGRQVHFTQAFLELQIVSFPQLPQDIGWPLQTFQVTTRTSPCLFHSKLGRSILQGWAASCTVQKCDQCFFSFIRNLVPGDGFFVMPLPQNVGDQRR